MRSTWPAKTPASRGMPACLFAACAVGYAFSPIDRIPDFIPVVGCLDDLVLVPLGIALALRRIPPAVMAECRDRAHAGVPREKPVNWVAAGLIVMVWVLLAAAGLLLITRYMKF